MYAKVLRRFFAYLLDGIVVLGFLFLVMIAMEYFFKVPLENTFFYVAAVVQFARNYSTVLDKALFEMYFLVITPIIIILYETLFVYMFSGTPGKKIMDIEVNNYRKGGAFLKSFIRATFKTLMIVSIIGLLIDIIVMLISPTRKSLHDLIAGSVVIFNGSHAQLSNAQKKEALRVGLESGKIKSYSEQVEFVKSNAIKDGHAGSYNHSTVLWWFLIIAMVFVAGFYLSRNFENYTKLMIVFRFTQPVELPKLEDKRFSGSWEGPENRKLFFVYLNDSLFINDGGLYFSDYKVSNDSKIMCKDSNGVEYSLFVEKDQLTIKALDDNSKKSIVLMKAQKK